MKCIQPQKGVRNLIQAPTQMICESITLNERSKSQKLLIVWLCLHEMSTIEQKKTHKDGTITHCPGLGSGRGQGGSQQ